MKAIIMAGGEGTRLRPLTCDCPKPMMRLMDRPVMDYSLELLALHGITESAVTLGYLPERIRDYFGDEAHGVRLQYYIERHPLGTAGGVRQARDFLTETFCVLSGDGVTDCDLTSALEFHRSHGSKATMVLKRVPNPTEYGLVMSDHEGRITHFVEKPAWGEVISDTINTGIYILEPEILDMIPDGEYDFGKQLFPMLASEGMLYGWVMDGYWCDIGDIQAYLAVHRDTLDGMISLPSLAEYAGSCTIADGAAIAEDVRLESPCYVGSNSRIEGGAVIGAYSVICSDVHIGGHASIKRSTILQGTRLMEGTQTRGCVIGHNVTLSPCARVYENCILGTGVSIGADSEIAPNTCIWPGKTISEATFIDRNVVWGGSASSCFHDGLLPVSSPSEALNCAQAIAASLRPREVILGRTPSAIASATWHSCAAGLMAQGVIVVDGGICTEPQLRYTTELMHTDCAILAQGNGIIPLAKGGLRLSQARQRSICALISRQDFPRPFTTDARPVIYSGSSEKAYIAMLASAFLADPVLAMPAAVHCENQLVLNLAEQAFERAGLTARFEWEDELMELFPDEIGIWLSPDGMSARFSHANGMLTDPQNELLLTWTALERDHRSIIAPERVTRAISDVALRYNAEVVRSGSSRSVFEQALSGYPEQLRLNSDGIYLAICSLSALTTNALTLTGWLSTMPKVYRAEKRLHMDDELRGRVLRSFAENSNISGSSGTLNISGSNAFAWISPDESRPECSIVAESRDMEAARELCEFCESELIKASEI